MVRSNPYEVPLPQSQNVPSAYGCIYGLYDPRDGELRYIGQTIQPLRRRLKGHCNETPRGHKSNWVRSLLSLGLKPDIRLIREASCLEDLDRLEDEIISEMRSAGANLTNIENGGRGKGKVVSAETRAKMSASHKGRKFTPEHRAALSKKVWTPEERAKLSAAGKGRVVSDATRTKLSEQQKGKALPTHMHEAALRANLGCVRSPETRAKMSAAQKGKSRSPDFRAKMRAIYAEKAVQGTIRHSPLSEEHRAKIAGALRGKPKSAGHRAKIKATYAAKKASGKDEPL